jgi:hypothetical protein
VEWLDQSQTSVEWLDQSRTSVEWLDQSRTSVEWLDQSQTSVEWLDQSQTSVEWLDQSRSMHGPDHLGKPTIHSYTNLILTFKQNIELEISECSDNGRYEK